MLNAANFPSTACTVLTFGCLHFIYLFSMKYYVNRVCYSTFAVLKVTVREDNGNTIFMTVRLYGPNTEYVIDRQRELQVRYTFLLVDWHIDCYVV